MIGLMVGMLMFFFKYDELVLIPWGINPILKNEHGI